MGRFDAPVGILHTRIVSGAGGGPEKTILNSPRHLDPARYRAIACYLHAPGDSEFSVIEARARERDCPLIGIGDAGALSPRTLWRLARICREEKIGIWHGHDYKTNLIGVLLRPLLGFRLVTTMHGWVTHTSRTGLYYAIDRWTLPRHHAVVAVSDDLFAAGRSAGVAEDRMHLIENAIDTEEFRRRVPAEDAPGRQTPPGRLVIGAVGRLSGEKGFDLLIEAVGGLIRDGHDLELRIAGEGPERLSLEAQIAALGLADRVRLLGFAQDTRSLFEGFDIFCLSSHREGLPNVILEAMAMEVPILSTRVGGMPAFGRDDGDMRLVDPGSAEGLREGLAPLCSDAALRRRLAVAARERVEREHSFTRRMALMQAVYDKVLAGR
ncbi:glycosyltransferase [Oceanibacterium hippocampi]|uniref:Alpha-D-kanosaminyltransferase n=1 Tax=Oceanibacterium hippocampi TaxID=745714 RepID=A0A1Y5TVN3_9PROT|nr:glycosyltransferase [Oceanibacterium hippocampi]SLN69241.1 Alpha-D-kanosaminyltransferase [Oceanibacterium hippocampi]